ncbi:uncharacterized protein LOC141901099 [Tubulanus polymorphus]|uniref:uncharacterized protein LOC141901099 n=1 Tax=Tubulanus polymorphus TaxID=672921 RepID=UPI003DA69652
MDTVLDQATITQERDFALVKMSSFPSKYSVYVEYCTKYTNQCKSTKPIETTDGSIKIEIKINPDQPYTYKLIVSESSDVIASRPLEVKKVDDKRTVTSPDPLTIVGFVLSIIAFVLNVILLVLLLMKRLRNRTSGMKNETNDSTTVYSNSNELKDTDSRVYAAVTPYVNVAFCELEPDQNNYEEVRN